MIFSSDKKGLGGKRFSWLYPLIIAAIAFPVICVVWLLKEATESEQAVVASLVAESQQRTLEDAEELIYKQLDVRLSQAVQLYEENGFSYISTLSDIHQNDIADSFIAWRERAPVNGDLEHNGDAILKKARDLIQISDEETHTNELLSLIESNEFDRYTMSRGRNAALTILMLALSEYEDSRYPDNLQSDLDAALTGDSRFLSRYRQYSYFVKRYGEYATRSEAIMNVKAFEVAATIKQSVDSEIEESSLGKIHFLDDIIMVTDSGQGISLLFKANTFMRAAAEAHGDIELFYSNAPKPEFHAVWRALETPLEFISLGVSSDVGARLGESKRVDLYFIIGAIVLALSVFAGIVIILLMRRQSDAAQLKNDLVATVTHELKTPVASIRLLVDTLSDPKKADKVNREEYLDLIGRENRRLGYLIDNFLSFSRMERGKTNFDLQAIDPLEVVANAEQAFLERFKGGRFEFSKDYAKNMGAIMGDVEGLTTALGNLLENALKYGGKEPEILLKVRDSSTGAQFSVRDNGQGIPRSDYQKIFQKFYQAKRTLSTHEGGVGLGLSIVSFIVSTHNGSVSLDSEIGVGSCFTITIPYA